MADAILLVRRQLRDGPTVLRPVRDEDRVVAEAAGPARLEDGRALADAEDLMNLARVPGGQRQRRSARLTLRHPPSVCRWNAVSRSIPDVARSISASSWALLNGVPSAVPWTSTSPPVPVMTTLK